MLKEKTIYESVEILDAGSEGKAVARAGDLVIFVPFVVPGDIVDIQVTWKKRSYIEGNAIKFHKYSDKRETPFCEHFGTCGGCRWQNMKYQDQLFYKQKQVEDNFQRIAKITDPPVLPIIPSVKTRYYRNKLEYTFSNRRWLLGEEMGSETSDKDMNALGFHIPMMFDRVLDIRNCYLQQDPSNAIRLETKQYAQENDLSFYDARTWDGFLRNLLIRISDSGDVMVILVFRTDDKEEITGMLSHLMRKFPEITSMYWVINPKKNDVINDLPFHLFSGKPYIVESMQAYGTEREISFRIGPASFFQTNSTQARILYKTVGEFAGFNGNETVYDLYTGTGTIANYIAGTAGKVIGIESIPSAIENARENSRINSITNAFFYTGEAEKVLTPEFISANGVPDIVITDPPRSGMHEKVVKTLLSVNPGKIIYVSCNPATQARDIALLKEKYDLVKCQPVDMFPHTQHVENVALLQKRDQ
ncbi:MAG: 23S rRNA (uracil(1939)-C(5))-methyltransferase RlmD [Bacteroidetes bacterium]|nr:23S rRNA (uracil(1939)-C(5))-methyltransferase RlmD [Bacteroidota bacterium]